MHERDVVHQLRETKSGNVVTKCGATGKNDKVRATVWDSEITCPACREG